MKQKLIAVFSVYILMYAALSFVIGKINCMEWSSVSRGFFVILLVIAIMFVFGDEPSENTNIDNDNDM